VGIILVFHVFNDSTSLSSFLTDPSAVFTQNAWDHVPPPPEHDKTITVALERQRKAPVSTDEQKKYNDKPARYWDEFYKANEANFFKDRKWCSVGC
jgi:tRNAThr (cytosine32-N3)-methyltransferase